MEVELEIKKYLEDLARKDFRLDLEPMREACSLLNDPQNSYASVHIVGTNGKGSTAAFLSTLLKECGYKVGLITSPHLIDVRERIQINQDPISWEAFSELIHEIRGILPGQDFLSFFEMMTLVGFEYFSKMGVEIAVVEAGMGGRFDATNVLKPQVAIFTPISLDHEIYLGDSVAKIAAEKCGILKPEMAVISAPQIEEAAVVIQKSCEKLDLELIWADPKNINSPLGLKGRHQKTNAASAYFAAKTLISEELLEPVSERAFLKTKWPGRLEILQENPTVLVDGAHNPAGIQTLKGYLEEHHSGQNIFFLVGVLNDKKWQEMFAPLAPLAKGFICVAAESSRALHPKELAKCLQAYGKPIEIIEEPIAKALPQILLRLNSPKDLLVATGSLYVVGEVMKSKYQTSKIKNEY